MAVWLIKTDPASYSIDDLEPRVLGELRNQSALASMVLVTKGSGQSVQPLTEYEAVCHRKLMRVE